MSCSFAESISLNVFSPDLNRNSSVSGNRKNPERLPSESVVNPADDELNISLGVTPESLSFVIGS